MGNRPTSFQLEREKEAHNANAHATNGVGCTALRHTHASTSARLQSTCRLAGAPRLVVRVARNEVFQFRAHKSRALRGRRNHTTTDGQRHTPSTPNQARGLTRKPLRPRMPQPQSERRKHRTCFSCKLQATTAIRGEPTVLVSIRPRTFPGFTCKNSRIFHGAPV